MLNKVQKTSFFVEKMYAEKKLLLNQDEICYSGVFGVADYETDLRFSKFKMADPIWQTKIQQKLLDPD